MQGLSLVIRPVGLPLLAVLPFFCDPPSPAQNCPNFLWSHHARNRWGG